MWENDECDFIDVTMGVGRLNEVMREFSLQAIREQNGRTHLNTALFTPFPGDQHNFGALVVEEIFANAGWATEALLTPKRQELLHIIAHKNFSLVGLTISCDYPADDSAINHGNKKCIKESRCLRPRRRSLYK